METKVVIIGAKELKAAIDRNPRNVVKQAKTFLVRGLAEYKKVVIRSPWTTDRSGGGAPVATGNLRDVHITRIADMRGTYGPYIPMAPYAPYVHGIEGMPRKRTYKLRPWLDYAKEKADSKVEKHYQDMLRNISGDLAK